MNDVDRARRALEDADRHLESAVEEALAAGVGVDDLAQTLAAPHE